MKPRDSHKAVVKKSDVSALIRHEALVVPNSPKSDTGSGTNLLSTVEKILNSDNSYTHTHTHTHTHTNKNKKMRGRQEHRQEWRKLWEGSIKSDRKLHIRRPRDKVPSPHFGRSTSIGSLPVL